ncbi:MAG: sigma-E processing peptidase SpoIIGA [Clostridia bacterium]|nr:sigma-E processing peptidase SpoIIGA [Clostridia bacterium]
MRTLYMDVYFLINFTVDILSLYFASLFAKIPTSSKRIIVSGIIGALCAVIAIFLPELPIVKLIASVLGLFIMVLIVAKSVSYKRKIKFSFALVIFEALIGGVVTFVWNIFDTYLAELFKGAEGGAVNRKMLFLSLIVLLSIGVFKMLVSFFSNIESEGCVDLEISFLGNSAVVSAFVDSGNLAIDPMDMSPVVLIKKEVAKSILPENIIDLCEIDNLDRRTKKRIRLIPISRGGATHVLVGIKMDAVKLICKEKNEEIKVTVAIDKEGGTFGGYKALMPSAALENVF